MSEWVRTEDLATLIEHYWEPRNHQELADRTELEARYIRRILARHTTYTSLSYADRICLELGLNLGVDIEILKFSHFGAASLKGSQPWRFTSETARAAIMKRWYGS